MKQQHNRSELTIGLDLGERRHRFCVLDGKGEVVEEGSLSNDRACLARLTAHYCGALADEKTIRYSLTKMVNAKLHVGSLRIALESRLIAGWQMIRPVGFRFLNAEQFGTILA